MSHRHRLLPSVAIASILGLIPISGLGAAGSPASAEGDAAQRSDPAVTFVADVRGISRDEAARRLARQDEALRSVESLDLDERADFGGVWVDRSDRVVVGVVKGAPASTLGIEDLARRSLLSTVEVSAPFRDLQAAADGIAADVRDLPQADRAGIDIAIDTPRNRVVLRVAPNQTKELQALVAGAEKAFGSLVTVAGGVEPVQPSACASGPSCGPPLRGGVEIFTATSGCTGGFYARSTSDNKPYLITAGHCPAGTWHSRASAGTTHVIGDRHSSHVGIYGDFGIVDIDNPLGWMPKPWVVVLPSTTTTLDEEYTIGSEGSSVVGTSVCKTGATAGTSCGFVEAVGVTVTYTTGPTVSNLARTSYCTDSGDSGGPVYRLHTAYGINVAKGGPCTSYYSGIGAAEAISNVEVVNAP